MNRKTAQKLGEKHSCFSVDDKRLMCPRRGRDSLLGIHSAVGEIGTPCLGMMTQKRQPAVPAGCPASNVSSLRAIACPCDERMVVPCSSASDLRSFGVLMSCSQKLQGGLACSLPACEMQVTKMAFGVAT